MRNSVRLFLSLFIITFLTSCSFFGSDADWNSRKISSSEDFYTEQVKPILDNRCVACHSCYNAPCQLKLSSYEGIERGANKDEIYDFNTVFPKKMTRLFEDAQSAKEWHEKFDFFPIIKKTEEGEVNLSQSTIYHMLNLKAENPYSVGNFQAEYSRTCPEIKTNPLTRFANAELHQMDKYKEDMPWAGMPYGLPALTDAEHNTLISWLAMGAPGPMTSKESDPNHLKIIEWEEFFNGESIKEKITSRYIYEHLVFAHIYFDNDTENFYQIIRAKNRFGKPEIIPTRRPYDDPGKTFFYRLRKITSTIVHKTHIIYPFSDAKMQRYRELFLDIPWASQELTLPSYKLKTSANPLETFAQMPAKSRYQFLLDDAQYHITTFIRGPVCRGQVALNVIDDHFWLFFVDPDSDVFVNDQEAMNAVKKYGATPARFGSHLNISALTFYKKSIANKEKLRKTKNDILDKKIPQGFGIDDIWDGDQHNENALLTIFRHFDSATVVQGAQGNLPQTVWVFDYLIFEDVYYNLVAGYDVYGAATHQVKTRIHMDHSRINSQDNFIDMLPRGERQLVRFEWSRNKESVFKKETPKGLKKLKTKITEATKRIVNNDAALKMKTLFPYLGDERKTKVNYQSQDHVKELLNKILSVRLSNKVKGNMDTFNCCDNNKSSFISEINSIEDFERESSKVFGVTADHPRWFPDVSLLRIMKRNGEDQAYTIVHNVAHWNVTYMFNESDRLRPEKDTINLFKGYVGSYPNYFFTVKEENLREFLVDIVNINLWRGSYINFVNKYGVNRMRSDFWEHYDFFNENFKQNYPLEAGILDLNRYKNY